MQNAITLVPILGEQYVIRYYWGNEIIQTTARFVEFGHVPRQMFYTDYHHTHVPVSSIIGIMPLSMDGVIELDRITMR